MKRTYVYLTGASLVCATGIISIALAQRDPAAAKADAEPAPIAERLAKSPRPIPLVPESTRDTVKFRDQQPAASDPFQAARREVIGQAPADRPFKSTITVKESGTAEDAGGAVRQVAASGDDVPNADVLAQSASEMTVAAANAGDREPASDRAAGDPFGLQNKAGAAPQKKYAVQTAAGEAPASEGASASSRSPWAQFPAPGQAVPSANQAVPSANQAVPSANQAVPSANQAVPSANQAVPSANQAVPSANQAVPTANQAVPTANQAAPTASSPAAASANQSSPSPALSAPATNQSTTTAAGADASARATSPIGGNSLRLKRNDQVKVDPFGGAEANAAQAPASKYPGRPAPFGNEAPDARAISSGSASAAQDGFVTVPRNANALSPIENGRSTAEGTGRPGNKQSDGAQTAQVTIEKKAPPEIQVGKPATFEIKVKNVGSVGAQNVEVHDEVPKGTQLISTSPKASRGQRGELMWVLGALKPGEETTVKVELMPVGEGEIGSVATLHFDAEATVRTISTRPELAVQVSCPRQVMIGDDVTLTINVSNPGTGAASGVVLEERVPTGFQHTATGRDDLEFEIGVLKPGESRQLDLSLKAVQAGRLVNTLAVRGDANLRVEEKSDIEVIAPGLKVGLSGPTKRFLDRPATYTVSVTNPGTAAAKDVELITYLPKGLKFVKADNSGHYDLQKHRVIWSLAELPPAESGSVKFTALPIEEGEQKMRIEGKAQQGLSDMEEQAILVEGVAAIMFEVTDVEDPVEVSGEATYEIRVINQGSRAATNIRVSATLPVEMKAIDGTGPTRAALDDKRVVFDALNRLAPKTDATFRIRAQVLRPGDLRVKAQVVTDEMQAPVTKEESTRVYQDE